MIQDFILRVMGNYGSLWVESDLNQLHILNDYSGSYVDNSLEGSRMESGRRAKNL